eukprot:636048-Prymnesium_polylepis.2
MRPAPIRILPGRSRHAPRRLASARCTTGHAHNVSTREGGSLLRMHHTRSGTAAPRVPGSCAWRPLVSLTLLLLLLLLLRVVEQSLELSAHHYHSAHAQYRVMHPRWRAADRASRDPWARAAVWAVVWSVSM